MELVRINENNLGELEERIPPDVAENIGREYYRGIATADGDASDGAALVWELKNAEALENKSAELIWMSDPSGQYGEELLAEFRGEAGEENLKRTFFELPPDEDLKELLTDQGFPVEEREGKDLYVSIRELSSHGIASGKVPGYVMGLGELLARQYRRGIMNCLFNSRKGVLEDLAYLPMSWFDQEVSSCIMTDGKASGFFLVHETPSGILKVEFLFAFEPDAQTNLFYMVRRSIQAAAEKFSPETLVRLPRHNDAAMRLTQKLLPGKKGLPVMAGEREE